MSVPGAAGSAAPLPSSAMADDGDAQRISSDYAASLCGRDAGQERLHDDKPYGDQRDRASPGLCGKSGWHGNLSRGTLA